MDVLTYGYLRARVLRQMQCWWAVEHSDNWRSSLDLRDAANLVDLHRSCIPSGGNRIWQRPGAAFLFFCGRLAALPTAEAMGDERAGLPEAQATKLAERLAGDPGLILPRHLVQTAATSGDPSGAVPAEGCGEPEVATAKTQRYVKQLLLHDAGVFLERHGKLLTQQELEAFSPLRGNYEVDFYLKLLHQEGRADSRGLVRNRRLAFFNRSKGRGHFATEAMQDRDPLLWQHLIGRYTQPAELMPAPGGKMYEGLLRQHDALELSLRVRSEREREAQRTEEEEDSDEEGEGEEGRGPDRPAGPSSSRRGPELLPSETPVFGGVDEPEEEDYRPRCAPEERRQALQEEFLEEMKVRFINGRDDFDYSLVDGDAGLDEDWAEWQTRDAEDRYFGSD